MKYFSVFDIKQNKSKNVDFKNLNRGWNKLWELGFVHDLQNQLFILL